MSYNQSFAGFSPIQRIQYAVTAYATRPTANSTAAIVIWLLGAAATKTFLAELGVNNSFSSFFAIVFALIFQAVLTLLEGPIWGTAPRTNRIRLVLGAGALFIDTALNTGGVWYFLQNLGNTTFWQAIAATTNTTSGPASATILGLSVLLGLAISAAPEALWDL